MHDRETKFTASFDAALKTAKLRIVKTAFRSPNTLAFAERFIQTLGQECLDYFIPIGERHLNHLVSEMVAHYHTERPHQSLDNDLLAPLPKARRKKPRLKPTRRNDNARRDRLQAAAGGLAAALLPQSGMIHLGPCFSIIRASCVRVQHGLSGGRDKNDLSHASRQPALLVEDCPAAQEDWAI